MHWGENSAKEQKTNNFVEIHRSLRFLRMTKVEGYSAFAKWKNRRAIRMAKTAHGTNESKEKTSPIVPAVDGIVINTPATSPETAVIRLKFVLPSITIEGVGA